MGHPSGKNEAASAALDVGTVARLRRECECDGGTLFRQFVGYFREDLGQAAKAFQFADLQCQRSTLERTAHRLRGSAGNFGARPLMNLCAQMEEYADSDCLTKAAELIPPLLEEIARVRSALEGLE